MGLINTIEHNGKTIQLFIDDFAEDPRKVSDHLGKMICFHGRYDLGDKHDYDDRDYSGWEAMEKALSKEYDAVLLPIYMYDHSGQTIATTPFSCPWDSGQIGFIGISKAKARKEYGWKVINKARIAKLTEYLESEVKEYDQFLRGEVYGYQVIDAPDGEEGEIVDSCWGFYNLDDAIEQAKANC